MAEKRMHYVYVLYSLSHDRTYVGMAMDCERRLHEHNSGRTRSTKAFAPWVIVHLEEYNTRAKAHDREKYLKSAAGRRWRKKHINWPRGATE